MHIAISIIAILLVVYVDDYLLWKIWDIQNQPYLDELGLKDQISYHYRMLFGYRHLIPILKKTPVFIWSNIVSIFKRAK